MRDKDRFRQCFTCELLDHCNEDSDDKNGSCTRFTQSKKFSEIYDSLHFVLEQLKEQKNE